MRYYVDTCIWLNLFKKEGDATKGIPYWQLAKEFIEKVVFSQDDEIVYSGIILRELQIKLGEHAYQEKRSFFEQEPRFIKVDLMNEDKVEARKLESRYDFAISFYDLLHMNIAKRLSLVLITRDRKLIEVCSENGVVAKRPEDL